MTGKWAIAAALVVLAAAPAASASTGNQQSTRRAASPRRVRPQPLVRPRSVRVSEPRALHLSQPAPGGDLRPRVIGGSNAVQGQWGFMAFVVHLDGAGNWDFVCSGTLVSPNVVLTAGHCAADDTSGAALDPSGFGVVTGAVDWSDATDRHVSTISQVVVDPSYDPSGPSHDAALLVLSSPVSSPTCPSTSSRPAHLLRTAVPRRIPLRRIQRLCALDPPSYNIGTCDGDSGGPFPQ